ncbi:MAG: SUMF1/EgtB/PvdO family nonheme iron enzyme [Bryobacterales bacterium]|nr:SUMF1/EgtB/PvdO family nonheme iron enzyme [Bryobacterales bacterium]
MNSKPLLVDGSGVLVATRSNSVLPDGAKVRSLRTMRGYTQEQLAEKAHIEKRTVESLEAGRPKYRSTLAAIARALGVDVCSLVQMGNRAPLPDAPAHAIETLRGPRPSDAVGSLDAVLTSVTDRSTGIELKLIPPGRFEMGTDELSNNERPPHWVYVSEFWMARTLTTNAQYAMFVDATGHRAPLSFGVDRLQNPQMPVVGVSWDDAVMFCEWLALRLGVAVTLPSEAQWEYAARGPSNLARPWGDGTADPHVGFPVLLGGTVEVHKAKCVGPFGVEQQVGNAWEWCIDVWDPNAYKTRANDLQIDPVQRTGERDRRSVRGPGWQAVERQIHAAYRCRNNRAFRGLATGFRIVAGTKPNEGSAS